MFVCCGRMFDGLHPSNLTCIPPEGMVLESYLLLDLALLGIFVQLQGCNLYIYYIYIIVVEPKRCISTACSEFVNSPKHALFFEKISPVRFAHARYSMPAVMVIFYGWTESHWTPVRPTHRWRMSIYLFTAW